MGKRPKRYASFSSTWSDYSSDSGSRYYSSSYYSSTESDDRSVPRPTRKSRSTDVYSQSSSSYSNTSDSRSYNYSASSSRNYVRSYADTLPREHRRSSRQLHVEPPWQKHENEIKRNNEKSNVHEDLTMTLDIMSQTIDMLSEGKNRKKYSRRDGKLETSQPKKTQAKHRRSKHDRHRSKKHQRKKNHMQIKKTLKEISQVTKKLQDNSDNGTTELNVVLKGLLDEMGKRISEDIVNFLHSSSSVVHPQMNTSIITEHGKTKTPVSKIGKKDVCQNSAIMEILVNEHSSEESVENENGQVTRYSFPHYTANASVKFDKNDVEDAYKFIGPSGDKQFEKSRRTQNSGRKQNHADSIQKLDVREEVARLDTKERNDTLRKEVKVSNKGEKRMNKTGYKAEQKSMIETEEDRQRLVDREIEDIKRAVRQLECQDNATNMSNGARVGDTKEAIQINNGNKKIWLKRIQKELAKLEELRERKKCQQKAGTEKREELDISSKIPEPNHKIESDVKEKSAVHTHETKNSYFQQLDLNDLRTELESQRMKLLQNKLDEMGKMKDICVQRPMFRTKSAVRQKLAVPTTKSGEFQKTISRLNACAKSAKNRAQTSRQPKQIVDIGKLKERVKKLGTGFRCNGPWTKCR